jgi:hypothetical protein
MMTENMTTSAKWTSKNCKGSRKKMISKIYLRQPIKLKSSKKMKKQITTRKTFSTKRISTSTDL